MAEEKRLNELLTMIYGYITIWWYDDIMMMMVMWCLYGVIKAWMKAMINIIFGG